MALFLIIFRCSFISKVQYCFGLKRMSSMNFLSKIKIVLLYQQIHQRIKRNVYKDKNYYKWQQNRNNPKCVPNISMINSHWQVCPSWSRLLCSYVDVKTLPRLCHKVVIFKQSLILWQLCSSNTSYPLCLAPKISQLIPHVPTKTERPPEMSIGNLKNKN